MTHGESPFIGDHEDGSGGLTTTHTLFLNDGHCGVLYSTCTTVTNNVRHYSLSCITLSVSVIDFASGDFLWLKGRHVPLLKNIAHVWSDELTNQKIKCIKKYCGMKTLIIFSL